jgi:hypothetical protein
MVGGSGLQSVDIGSLLWPAREASARSDFNASEAKPRA